MSELEERLNAVLNDPEELARVTRLASQLMGQSGAPASDGNNGLASALSQLAGSGGDGIASALSQLTGQSGGTPDLTDALRGIVGSTGKSAPLAEALCPYLDEGRAAKLRRALRISSVAALALRAFREGDYGI